MGGNKSTAEGRWDDGCQVIRIPLVLRESIDAILPVCPSIRVPKYQDKKFYSIQAMSCLQKKKKRKKKKLEKIKRKKGGER